MSAEAPRTVLSRIAAGTVGVLAIVHLVTALTDDGVPAYARVLALATCTLTSVAAMLLHRADSFASRLVAVGVAVLSASGAVLVATMGLPGGAPSGFTGTQSLTVGLALAVALVLVLDARKHAAVDPAPPPYAL